MQNSKEHVDETTSVSDKPDFSVVAKKVYWAISPRTLTEQINGVHFPLIVNQEVTIAAFDSRFSFRWS